MKRGLRDLSHLALGLWLGWLTVASTSCLGQAIEQPDLALACTQTGPTACKADFGMTGPIDGMPPPADGNSPPADGMIGPPGCMLDADCKMACPIGSKGCMCATLPMRMSKGCVPTCTTTADCPTPPMGTVTCDTTQGACIAKM